MSWVTNDETNDDVKRNKTKHVEKFTRERLFIRISVQQIVQIAQEIATIVFSHTLTIRAIGLK